MDNKSKAALVAAVAAGYVLGRTKKGRLALTGAALVMGRSLEPRQLLFEGIRRLRRVPAVAALGDQLRDELYPAARNAAGSAISRRVGSLTGGGQKGSDEEAEHEDTGGEDTAEDRSGEDTEGEKKEGAPGRTGRTPARKRAAKPAAKKGAAKPASGTPRAAGRTGERKKRTSGERASSTRSRSGR